MLCYAMLCYAMLCYAMIQNKQQEVLQLPQIEAGELFYFMIKIERWNPDRRQEERGQRMFQIQFMHSLEE